MQNAFELVRSWERTFFGPDVVNEAEEQVQVIQENLKIAKSQQKS